MSVGLGKTSIEIIWQVLLHQHDLVIKTARGRTDGRRISIGTTAMHLVRKCPCPVWLVAPGAKLHALHAWDPRVESLVQTKTDDVTVTRYIDARHEAAKQALADLLNTVHVPLPERQAHLVLGHAVDTIVAVTAEQKVDLVVLRQVGRSNRNGQLIGSVTEEALTRLDCGIFCVKPDGFKSPIRLD